MSNNLIFEQLDSAFKFSSNCNKHRDLSAVGKIQSNFLFLDEIMTIYYRELQKLPFHLNVLDAVPLNENAHSKILSMLLKQTNGNEHTIFDSFLDTFINQRSSHNLKSTKPDIQFNSDLIDIRIRDIDFAIIIENKILDAVDQSSQIARYIEKIRMYGYDLKKIFILYLTRDGSKQVANYSWRLNDYDFKEIFDGRFFSLSYREDILPWLEEMILPNCRVKDVILISAIQQYVDYLKGIYNKRAINYNMNTEIKNHIKTLLNLNSTPEENLEIVSAKLEEMIKTQDQLAEVKKSIEVDCLNKWVNDLEESFPDIEIINKSLDKSFPKIGVKLLFNNTPFSLLIENDGRNVYYGIGRHESSTELSEEIKEFVKPLIHGFKSSMWWYGYRYSTYNEIYILFKELVIKTIDALRSAENR